MSGAVPPWRGGTLDERLARAAALGLALAACAPGAAHAQGVLVEPQVPSVDVTNELFPASVPGFDQERGLQLPSLGRAEDIGTGVRAGSFVIRPALSEGVAYDTNTRGTPGGPASAYENTTAAVAANSDWSRNRLGAYLGVANSTYFDTPQLSRTDWKAALGGGYTIGRGDATLGYSHLALHLDPTALGVAVGVTLPSAFQVDDVRADYTARFGRTALTPYLDFSMFRYGPLTLAAGPTDQSFRNHDVLQAGVAVRYGEMETRSLLLTVGAIHTSYTQPQPAVAPADGNSAVALAGFDWQITGPIALRVLVGIEAREFVFRRNQSRTVPIGQVVATWRPTLLTTVTGMVARSVEDAVGEDTSGTIYSRAEAGIAHELRRNVTLQGRLGVQVAQFLSGGGTQTDGYVGFGATWQLNRRVGVSANNTFDVVSGAPLSGLVESSGSPGTALLVTGPFAGTTGNYTRDVLRVQISFAL